MEEVAETAVALLSGLRQSVSEGYEEWGYMEVVKEGLRQLQVKLTYPKCLLKLFFIFS